jgi:DNA-binding PadR family transcriptional regulator
VSAAVEPTQTGYTLLGLLSFGVELSGYELKQWADNLKYFWSAPAMSQVYRELERLTAGGLVDQRRVVRDGTRATKVYRLTPLGEQVVRSWLAEAPAPPVLRHPAALRVFFGHLLDADELRAALETHRAWCERTLAELADLRAGLGDEAMWRNPALIADWGLGYYQGELAAMAAIEDAVTGDDPAGDPAGDGSDHDDVAPELAG